MYVVIYFASIIDIRFHLGIRRMECDTPPPPPLLGCRRPPVLLQHGLLDCSASWVVNGASRSFGFLLAEAGFDVWMGNARGNTFSRNHTTLPTSSEEFWAFTWDDHAAHDIPGTVRYVLELSGAPSLGYIGRC